MVRGKIGEIKEGGYLNKRLRQLQNEGKIVLVVDNNREFWRLKNESDK